SPVETEVKELPAEAVSEEPSCLVVLKVVIIFVLVVSNVVVMEVFISLNVILIEVFNIQFTSPLGQFESIISPGVGAAKTLAYAPRSNTKRAMDRSLDQ
ncbi:MAG: hypothetical protein WC839_04370, partial [Candidatus Paceibacterota bacterium]